MEYIADLQEMAETAILDFIGVNRCPPGRVFFFRDGVSEGEFSTVARHEIEAIEGKFCSQFALADGLFLSTL